jgi:hypothetical protein
MLERIYFFVAPVVIFFLLCIALLVIHALLFGIDDCNRPNTVCAPGLFDIIEQEL